jgi:hypothetical protein
VHDLVYPLLNQHSHCCIDRHEEILQRHSRLLENQLVQNGISNQNQASPTDQRLFSPVSHSSASHVPRAETALFLQKPSIFPSTQNMTEYSSGGSLAAPTSGMVQGNGFQQHLSMDSISQPASDYYSHANQPVESPSLNMSPESRQPMENATDQDLPPYDLLYTLADLYFKHVNTWCPILHRGTTLDSLFGPATLDEADRILLHAIVATTLRFSTDNRLSDERRKHYHDVSKQKVLLYGLENSSVKALRALVILMLDLIGTSNGPPGWNLWVHAHFTFNAKC